MIATYKAHLQGNRLDWQESAPPDLTTTVSVLVTVLPSEDTTSGLPALPSGREQAGPHVPSGRKLAEILRRLASENPVPSIPDPSAWQQETRQDRTLPGREV